MPTKEKDLYSALAHHEFVCSNCDAPLADICVTKPDAKDRQGNPLVWNFVCLCPHCGDRSYPEEVRGLFSIGANEKSEKYTLVEGYDEQEDPIVIKTVKLREWT